MNILNKGNWKSGRRDGFGVFISADGTSQFSGEWLKDEMVKGVLTYPSGDTYEGLLHKGLRVQQVMGLIPEFIVCPI